MILFALPEFESAAAALRESIPDLRNGHFRASRFNNGELFIAVETEVRRKECAIFGSFTPPDSELLTTLLLAHTLWKEGAKSIVGVVPYVAYSRQDKNKAGQSLAAAWTGELARASGIDRIVTIDAHSAADEQLSPIPFKSVSPAPVFAAALREYHLTGATIIAPDKGAITRCEAIRAAAGLDSGAIPWFEKQRLETGIQHLAFHGETGMHVILVDDILDTGATLISACERLLCAGVEDIQIMVTHGLFTGSGWERLWGLGVSRIFCTDTVSRIATDESRIVILSILPVLARAISGL
jgi:ribose-phosphate pyrophosphokinase